MSDINKTPFAVLLYACILAVATSCASTPEGRAAQAETVKSAAETVQAGGRAVGGPVGEIVATLAGIVAVGAGAYGEAQRRRANREAETGAVIVRALDRPEPEAAAARKLVSRHAAAEGRWDDVEHKVAKVTGRRERTRNTLTMPASGESIS